MTTALIPMVVGGVQFGSPGWLIPPVASDVNAATIDLNPFAVAGTTQAGSIDLDPGNTTLSP